MESAETAYVRFCPITEIQAVGLSPTLITGIFLRNIRQHFSPGQVESPYLRKLVWVGREKDPIQMDEKLTTIYIEAEETDKPLNASQCARIILDRLDYDTQPDMAVGSNSYQGDFLANDGLIAGMAFSDVIIGAHNVSCQAKEKGMAEELAWEVNRHLRQFRMLWMQEYGFDNFKVGKAGKAAPLEKGEGYGIDVNVEYAFTDNYVVAEVAARFQGVAMKLKSE